MSRYEKPTDAMYADLAPKERINKELIEETKNLLMIPYDDPIGNATRFAAKLGCDPDELCTVIAGALLDDLYKVSDELSATYDEDEDTFTITYLDIKVTVKDGDIFSSPSS